jgi:hypothetical protein
MRARTFVLRGGAATCILAAFVWQNVRTIPRIRDESSYDPLYMYTPEGEAIHTGFHVPREGKSIITFEQGWPLAYRSRVIAWRHSPTESFETIAYVRAVRKLTGVGADPHPGDDTQLFLGLLYPAWIAVIVNVLVGLGCTLLPFFLTLRRPAFLAARPTATARVESDPG